MNEEGIKRFLLEFGVQEHEMRTTRKWINSRCIMAEHYALREIKPKTDMESEYTRGFESAVSIMKVLVSGRIRAYTEHGLVGPERLEAFRTVMDEDIACMEMTIKYLRGMA